MRALTVNAGSSSLKLALIDTNDQRVIDARELQAPRAQIDPDDLRAALRGPLAEADAVGHRIVHGGALYVHAVAVDAHVEAKLQGLADLAPLHQEKSLSALRAVSAALPHLPAVACFDTAFHASLPAAAATYALPAAWRTRWDLRRYGFHGLSHAWVARHAPQLLGDESGMLRIVSAHLGAGASLCAIAGRRSLDTTMGFTPLEGLVMATRCGSLDPGMLLWLAERTGLTVARLAHALEHESGLLGLAGSADMREILSRRDAGEQDASLAFSVYIHRLQAGVAAMSASLGGLDALVFTGGVGERASAVRAAAASGLAFLGVKLDLERNERARGDAEISARRAPVRALVMSAREDLEIAREVDAVLAPAR